MRLRVEQMERSYSDLVAQQFEIAVRGWLIPVGGREERVISYEQRGRNKRYTRRFRELDFIIDGGDCLYIGELKVSSSSKRLGRAYRQLSESIDILKRTGRKVRPILIYINLSYMQAGTMVDKFAPDVREMHFQRRSVNGRDYDFLHLSPIEIFDWAIENTLIKDKNLLQLALEEAAERYGFRQERRKLRDGNVPESEWPDELSAPKAHPNVVYSYGEPKKETHKTQLGIRLKEAFGRRDAQRTKFGTVIFFDPNMESGEVGTLSSGRMPFHLESFSKKSSSSLKQGQVITFKRKATSEDGHFRLAGCRVLETPADFTLLMSLLGEEIGTGSPFGESKGMGFGNNEIVKILKQGTSQIFGGKPDQYFIDTILHHYDKELRDDDFVPFCSYLENIAVPLIETDDRDMLEQTLYCHFFENLRAGVLFHAWKQAAFRYIAYTDGMDYEIPREIILQHSNYLTDSDWKRIEQYSYAASTRKTKQK